MKVSPAQLFPVLRSDAQGMILAKLFMRPDEGFGITQLAKFADVSVPTAMREVDRLMEAQLVTQKTFGRARVIQVNQLHPLFAAIKQIILFSYGPIAVLPAELTGVEGLEGAFLFGPWAAKISRNSGPEPQDVDVILVGYMNRIEAARAAARARDALERDINVQFVSSKEWAEASTEFVQTVKAQPLVQIPLG
jgi:hypothetical protein